MIGHLQRLIERWRAVFGEAELDREFDEEAAAHIALATDENMRRGMSEDDARREALLRFGGLLQSKEHHRTARGLPFLEVALQDLRYAARTLRRDLGFAVVAVLMLGLGLGGNVAVFSVVNEVLLRPLPFENARQLVWIEQAAATGGLSGRTYSVSAYEGLRARTRALDGVTGYYAFSKAENYRLGSHGNSEPLTAMSVLDNFFQVLGVQPAIGRAFTPEDAIRGGHSAALLAYPFWLRQFAGEPRVVGQTIDLNGQPVTVIGVLPDGFDFGAVFTPGAKIDAFVPVVRDDMRNWGNTLALIGRLRPGVTVDQADAEVGGIAPELYFNVTRPDSKGVYTAKVVALKEHVSGPIRRSLVVLWCAVGFTLLIVCVNLANLLIARTGARSKELAMRAALGAGRGRLIRQLLTESVVLASAGAVVGLGLAWLGTLAIVHQDASTLPLSSSVRVDGAAVAWALLLAAASCVAFGLVPALRLSAKDLQSALKNVGHGMSTGRNHQRLRASLVIAEMALACVLLLGASLLLRSFLRVLDVDLGFRPAGVSTVKVEFRDGTTQERRAAMLEELVRTVSAIPGIETAGITDNLPLEGNRAWAVSVKGKQYRNGELPNALVYMITPGYLETMGTPLRMGRLFEWSDGPNTPAVVVFNEAAARALWPSGGPMGQIAVINGVETRVVGVVSDVRESSPERTGAWQMYLPATQIAPSGATLTIRSGLPAAAIAPSITRTLRSLNPEQPAMQLRPMQASVDRTVASRRFFMLIVSAFAALGVLLASLGVYGVISYSVVQRTQEIGIRMALGATTARVQLDIIWQTMRVAAVGVALGVAAAGVMSHVIASMLFETAPTDTWAFIGTVLLLACAALAAAMLPAYRAAQIDPARTIRPI